MSPGFQSRCGTLAGIDVDENANAICGLTQQCHEAVPTSCNRFSGTSFGYEAMVVAVVRAKLEYEYGDLGETERP